MSKLHNPRFAAYAKAHGMKPNEMLEYDEERFPGGKMAGFICWMSQQWQDWCLLHGKRRTASGSRDSILGPADHAAFDEWLAAKTQSQGA